VGAGGRPGRAVGRLVVAAFGVFEPTFLAEAYELGRATASRDDVVAARLAGSTAALKEVLGADPEVGELADVLLEALDTLSSTGRPLFSGLRALPRPTSPHGRLWRAADMVREHRGDGHLAACVAAGLEPVAMNVLTELWVGYPLGSYTPTRGHSAPVIAAAVEDLRVRGLIEDDGLSPAGAALRDDIEKATDASQANLMVALGGRREWAIATAAKLSEKVVAAGVFKGDGLKRAAG
jgi:helix-turn-helix protein